MALSKIPLVRVILVPYLVLFFLFALVAGAGSTWLYFKAREAQAHVVMHGLLATVSPLVDELSQADAGQLITNQNSWLHHKIEGVFSRMPDLLQVRVRSSSEGFSKHHAGKHTLMTESIPGKGLEVGSTSDMRSSTAASRLYSETASLLRIEFSFEDRENGSVSLEFGFSRAALQDAVGLAMAIIVNTITLFNIIGIAALALAFAVTLWGVSQVRMLDEHVQKLYQYATAAELMAGLVHDLRNPLASFRANIAALKIMPRESNEILAEMDQDLVRLDEKLGSMLDLTKKRDEPMRPVAVHKLFETVRRQADPVLQKNNLKLEIQSSLDHPVELMENSLKDALLNLVLNSAESGQQEGSIVLSARWDKGDVLFEIADRGNGLPENVNIFEPFVTTRPTGNGLGLAISSRTTEAHGGTLRARNRRRGGALFTLRIPQPPGTRRKA